MNLGIIARALGALLWLLAATGIAPLLMDWSSGEPLRPWTVMLVVAVGLGAILLLLGRRGSANDLHVREGMAITTLTWLVFSLVAGLGIHLAAPPASYIHGWFEAMSGFTTTGSTIFGDPGFLRIEELTPGLKLWRSIIQWMGGIGIVVISLSVLPMLMGASGFQMYRAEVPGLDKDRLAPRIADTARILVSFYLALSASVVVALMLCGVSLFDAVCHTFTCVSTGGFSPYDDSIEGLGSVAAEWVLLIAMLASGINFGLILLALRGRLRRFWRSSELRLYLGLIVAAWVLLIAVLAAQPGIYVGQAHDLIRDAGFQTVSMATTTGFGTGYDTVPAAWDAWPAVAQLVLLFLMIGGACSGSTAGGMKMVRYIVAWRGARRELRRYTEPARLTPISLDGAPLRDPVVTRVGAFIAIYAVSWAVGTLLIALGGNSAEVAASASLSALSNIGPGLGTIGPAENYRSIGEPSQVVCLCLMLLGRLEFFGVLATLWPQNWRR
ncbi:MAG: TrkH family potassium uptake protein [Planctomycetota bacterium]